MKTTKQMLEALGAKYGGKAQAVLAMADQVAALKAAAHHANFDFHDVCDLADMVSGEMVVKARKPAPLLAIAGFDENDAWVQ